ncbi:MAG: Multidrug resistance transporter, Bcr/CflA family, partial [uncultured Friedmanniella sp.]
APRPRPDPPRAAGPAAARGPRRHLPAGDRHVHPRPAGPGRGAGDRRRHRAAVADDVPGGVRRGPAPDRPGQRRRRAPPGAAGRGRGVRGDVDALRGRSDPGGAAGRPAAAGTGGGLRLDRRPGDGDRRADGDQPRADDRLPGGGQRRRPGPRTARRRGAADGRRLALDVLGPRRGRSRAVRVGGRHVPRDAAAGATGLRSRGAREHGPDGGAAQDPQAVALPRDLLPGDHRLLRLHRHQLLRLPDLVRLLGVGVQRGVRHQRHLHDPQHPGLPTAGHAGVGGPPAEPGAAGRDRGRAGRPAVRRDRGAVGPGLGVPVGRHRRERAGHHRLGHPDAGAGQRQPGDRGRPAGRPVLRDRRSRLPARRTARRFAGRHGRRDGRGPRPGGRPAGRRPAAAPRGSRPGRVL